ncbi:ribosomal protein S9 [Candidatus Carsonella ruddii HT isolate Thao2000]|uniref:Small ribosomal subunit protein uS9 n=1 Tax=Candidatus Carsonella ruddii HT isolate Thao2000 TaxID=1202539 RepID=J3TEF0_CARRU|nr:uS9 family ribosomal protein [Candidatus Carsonella ruddii]AFP84092.1 ribosomal protein S9 [Candidatus Carsonella ruddii HT isolate Thao2000]
MKYISYSKKKNNKTKTIMTNGNGKIFINGNTIGKYFGNFFNKNFILLPLIISNLNNKNFFVITKGGGKGSQVISIRISFCKCILLFNYNYKTIFRKLNFYSIDDRIVERKKYGYKKSRKKEQYSKR